ncbi:TPA: hypothetical protein ENG04_00470 [Candidatus Poribacteria bacterium]|nr:hypothetical protein [Candidatus Poribacteria bacterium]HEX28538.1 hypothetical protein [Candidatus Poribacteria bacterium]
MALGLSRNGALAWDGEFFYLKKNEEFVPVAEIPFESDMKNPKVRILLRIAWFLLKFRDHLDSFLDGNPLPSEPIRYPFDQKGGEDLKHFKHPGLCLVKSDGKVIRKLKRPEPFLERIIYSLIKSEGMGIKLGDQIYILEDYIATLNDYIAGYEEEVKKTSNYLPPEAKRLLREFNTELRGRWCQRYEILFYERAGWRLLFNPMLKVCTVEKEGRPFVIEDENGRFYLFDEPFSVGVRLNASSISFLIKDGVKGMTPRITRPRRFKHPFVNSDNQICTAGWAEKYQNPNPISGIIELIMTAHHVLRAGYSGFRGEGARFTPYNSLSELGRTSLSSLKEAQAMGYPIYRFYIQDRR